MKYVPTGQVIAPDSAPIGAVFFSNDGTSAYKKHSQSQYESLRDGTIHNFTYKSNDMRKEAKAMQKPLVQRVQAAIKPYEKYLVAAAVLLVLDHFILKGAMTSRIQELTKALGNRCLAILDGAIARLGGE